MTKPRKPTKDEKQRAYEWLRKQVYLKSNRHAEIILREIGHWNTPAVTVEAKS